MSDVETPKMKLLKSFLKPERDPAGAAILPILPKSCKKLKNLGRWLSKRDDDLQLLPVKQLQALKRRDHLYADAMRLSCGGLLNV